MLLCQWVLQEMLQEMLQENLLVLLAQMSLAMMRRQLELLPSSQIAQTCDITDFGCDLV